jgi:hypothetical protein
MAGGECGLTVVVLSIRDIFLSQLSAVAVSRVGRPACGAMQYRAACDRYTRASSRAVWRSGAQPNESFGDAWRSLSYELFSDRCVDISSRLCFTRSVAPSILPLTASSSFAPSLCQKGPTVSFTAYIASRHPLTQHHASSRGAAVSRRGAALIALVPWAAREDTQHGNGCAFGVRGGVAPGVPQCLAIAGPVLTRRGGGRERPTGGGAAAACGGGCG